MDEKQDERLVVSFQKIAKALTGIHEEFKRAGKRYWPEPKEQREAVLSHVPNAEDEAKKNLGLTDQPIEKWLNPEWLDESDSGIIGERSSQWIAEHPEEKSKEPDASAETPIAREENRASSETPESKT
jgi:hypothetical protein